MKTSKKILLAVAGFIIVIFFVTLILLRNGVQSLQSKAELKYKYETMSVEDFDNLDFSSHYVVKIRQGKECNVELTAEKNSLLKPKLENRNGTLYFTVDSATAKENTDSIHVRITMPSLQEIKAIRGAKIQLENFQTDSLRVVLENGCVFTGINNTVKHASYKTSGDAWLNFTDIY